MYNGQVQAICQPNLSFSIIRVTAGKHSRSFSYQIHLKVSTSELSKCSSKWSSSERFILSMFCLPQKCSTIWLQKQRETTEKEFDVWHEVFPFSRKRPMPTSLNLEQVSVALYRIRSCHDWHWYLSINACTVNVRLLKYKSDTMYLLFEVKECRMLLFVAVTRYLNLMEVVLLWSLILTMATQSKGCSKFRQVLYCLQKRF